MRLDTGSFSRTARPPIFRLPFPAPGTPVPAMRRISKEPMKPIEMLRTIHSFHPCIAYAAHLCDP